VILNRTSIGENDMASGRTMLRSFAALITVAILAACGANDAADRTDETATDPGMDAMAGHDMGTMPMDSAMMQRHAAEMDSMAVELRAHVAGMRQLAPGEWHARMNRHAPLVARMLGMMERQMSEMDMGMNMDAAHMGAMMGMSADEHGTMLQGLDALRAEVEHLQTATRADVQAQMPAHLDRLERMVEVLEQSADHMGSM
jgi:hypothetical protein